MKTDKTNDMCTKQVYDVGRKIWNVDDPTWYMNTFLKTGFWILILLTMCLSLYLKKIEVNPFINGSIVFMISGGLIIGYFYVYLKNFGECAVMADPMNEKLFSIFGFPISSWPLAHFVTYFLFTIIFPTYWFWVICYGIAWEGVELFMKKVAGKKTLSRTARTRLGSSGEYQYLTYWESTWEDIIINTLSVLLALLIMRFVK